MTPEIIIPRDQQHWLELRTHDLTSTDIAALFGISPYCTPYELWHRKRDRINVQFDENERMKWGTRLQDAIAAGIGEEHDWSCRRQTAYFRLPDIRLGTSIDFTAIENSEKDSIIFLLEIKNVDSLQFLKEWIKNEKGNYEAPYHIEIQVQHQLLVTGHPFGYIGVLIGGNRLELIKRTADKKVHDAILLKAAEFWRSIDENNPPSPDMEADAGFISKLYGYAEPGKLIDISQDTGLKDLADEYTKLKGVIKDHDKRCESIKAEVLMKIGDAEKAIHPTFSISAGVIAPTWIEAYERKGYRNFRITPKKEK